MEIASYNSSSSETALKKICDSVPVTDPLRASFLQRLGTFHTLNWAGKPVDPPVCANYGWELVEEDILKCSICNQYLCAKLPPPKDSKAYTEACSKLKAKLVTAHSRFCIFNTSHQPDNLATIERISNKELLSELKQYVKNNCLDVHLSLCRIDEIKRVFLLIKEMCSLSDTHLSSFTLFLTGWSLVKDEQQHLFCSFCNRKWSVVSYSSREVPQDGNCSAPQNPCDIQNQTVDPVLQHQRWCAWRNEKQGWESRLEQFARIVDCSNEARSSRNLKRCASLSEDMKVVRKMLSGTP